MALHLLPDNSLSNYLYLKCFIFQILLVNKEVNPTELDFLLRFPTTPNVTSPVDFLSNNGWGGIKVCCQKALLDIEAFLFKVENKSNNPNK